MEDQRQTHCEFCRQEQGIAVEVEADMAIRPEFGAQEIADVAAGAVDRPSGTDDVAMGVGYLRYLHDLFGRSTELGRGRTIVPVADQRERQRFVAAAYNAGEGAVARAQRRVAASGRNPTDYDNIRPYLPSITQAYVDRVGRFATEERAQPTAAS